MTQPRFLMPFELATIESDFEGLLLHSEACNLTVTYVAIEGDADTDEVYGIDDRNEREIISVPGIRGLQEIIKPHQEDILRWGILQVGDCIFYISKNTPLNSFDDEMRRSLEITDASGVHWKPVPTDENDFLKAIRFRLGNSFVGQVIPARLKQ